MKSYVKSKIRVGIVFTLLLFLPLILAETGNLGTFKQNSCIRLLQICTNCTYCNISSVVYPDLIQALGQVQMTKIGTEYNYTFCNTSQLGTYTVNGFGDDGGIKDIFIYDFEITPQGWESTAIFYFIFILIIVLIMFGGYYLKNVWILWLGSILILLLGFFISFNGIDIIKDTQTTWGIAIVVWALGIYFIYLCVEESLKNFG